MLGGGRLPEHPAKVDEMLLARGAFRQLHARPFGDEIDGGHLARLHGEIVREGGGRVENRGAGGVIARRDGDESGVK